MKRRDFLGTAALASMTAVTGKASSITPIEKLQLKNNIHQSVCKWCYDDIPLEEFLGYLNQLGLKAIDLIGPADWPTLQKYDIYCSMCNGAEINLVDGWNNPKNHEILIKNYTELIPQVADNGYKNLICFSGNRRGMDDYVGLDHCVEGLSQIMPLAEQHGVVLQMELFNSVDHPDYMCDNSLWGVQLCKRLGSDNFKLLFDIYHMQINEGDIIRSIRNYHEYFGHYHTAGVPGRNEIDETQELYYPAIMRAILEVGFEGHVAQEFIPKHQDRIKSLREAVLLCDV